MHKYSAIIFSCFILVASSCKVGHPVQINSKDIKGQWFLNKWTVFNVLIFDDKTVFIDNHVDTVFTLNYSISSDSLITWSGEGGQKFKHKIISFNKDSMVLDGIDEVNEQRTYYRKNKRYK